MRKRIQILFVTLFFILWTVPASALLIPVYYPTPSYLGQTEYIDFSSVPDSNFNAGYNSYGVVMKSISDGFLTVNFSSPMYKLSVPDTWATWSVSPNSQRQSLLEEIPVLISDTLDPNNLPETYIQSIIMTFSTPVTIFGFEAEPDIYNENYLMTASFYNGPTLLGTIPRIVGDWQIDPTTGARLFAASSTTPITSVQFSIQKTDTDQYETPFALGAFRYAVPEPAAMLLLVTGLISLAAFRRKLS